MKGLFVVAAAVTLLAAVSFAGTQSKPNAARAAAAAAGGAGTWTGEVLDAGCYLGHGAMGEKHRECALKCAANGMPIMLMLNGQAVLLTPNHDNPDPYNALKGMAGSVAVVSGTMSKRGGVSGIDVTGAKLASTR